MGKDCIAQAQSGEFFSPFFFRWVCPGSLSIWGRRSTHQHQPHTPLIFQYKLFFQPFLETAVPFWGQTTSNLSDVCPKWDCSPNTARHPLAVEQLQAQHYHGNGSFSSPPLRQVQCTYILCTHSAIPGTIKCALRTAVVPTVASICSVVLLYLLCALAGTV